MVTNVSSNQVNMLEVDNFVELEMKRTKTSLFFLYDKSSWMNMHFVIVKSTVRQDRDLFPAVDKYCKPLLSGL